jgi:hypothetical protein
MNKEIEIFITEIKKYNTELSASGYSLYEEKTYNPDHLEHIFYEIKYSNHYKIITFDFYPSTTKLCTSQIVAYVTFNSMSFGISEYLAYLKFQRKLRSRDADPYRFIIDSKNLEKSISQELNQIFELLFGELKKYLTTDEWISIPMHDPRDDY